MNGFSKDEWVLSTLGDVAAFLFANGRQEGAMAVINATAIVQKDTRASRSSVPP
jgi:hypothetical protein